MCGHGCPNFLLRACRFRQCQSVIAGAAQGARLLKLSICLALVIFLIPTNQASPQTSNESSVRLSAASEEPASDLKLRFAWGGGTPQKWQGKISIKNGRFTDSRVLAITSDAPSTVINRGDELAINHRIATSYGGVDASIELSGDTAVKLLLTNPSGKSFEQTWTLSQLIAGVNESIDGQQNRISVSRTPGDHLRVNVNRPHLVFEPGETWRFETNVQRSEFANQSLRLKMDWKQGDTKTPISNATGSITTDENGSSAATMVEVTVPNEEGAHDLWIECETQSSNSTFGQFLRTKKIARRVQVIVLAGSAPSSDRIANWQTIETLNAQQLRGNFRTPWPVPRMPGSNDPVRTGELSLVSISDSNSNSNSDSDSESGSDSGSKWAVQLGVGASLTIPVPKPETPGSPIRVSLRYRTIPGTKLGVNYLSATQQVLHGMDSGVTVPRSDLSNSNSEKWLMHTFHLWPEEDAGALFISNGDANIKAQLGELKFESGPSRLASNARPDSDIDNTARRERMAFLESPDFSGLFQAARKIDPQSGQALDDWATFHDAIDRLTQHLKANFYDGAFVTIVADGSALYPSFGLAPGPRFDSGLFSSEGCDPIQKDVFELMLRMFDREGLKLVPVMTLNSTLQMLESIREADLMSFDLIDIEGRSVDFNRSQLPIYNPLDRALQGVCSQNIARFADRYSRHDSFGGLALTCRPDCCTLLSGTQHGFDNITLQRFVQDAGVDPAKFDANTLLLANVDNPTRDAWLAWRSEQMAQWYRDIAISVRNRPSQKLYLLPIDLDRNTEIATAMSPSLHRSGDFGQAMRNLGLVQDGTNNRNDIAILSTKQVAPGLSLSQNRIGLNIEQANAAQQFLAQQTVGSLFIHRGNWRRIDSAYTAAKTEDTSRKQLYTIAGASNRRRYIEAIRKLDSRLFIDGGSSLSFGSNQTIEPTLRILRELPSLPFEDIGNPNAGPVCMRQLSINGTHYFYAVNDSPWPVEVIALLNQKQLPRVLQASANKNGKAAPLTTLEGKEVLLERSEGRNVIRIFLEPWSMYAGTSETNSAFNPYAIESFQVSLPEHADSQLRKRLYQLKNKLAKAKTASPMKQLLNGSFESFADPNQSGWEFGNHDEATFELDSSEYRDGRTSLLMQTTGKPVWIRSNTLRRPETGRLSVSVWLRTSRPDGQLKPRIAVEGISDGESIYRFGTIGAAVSGDGGSELDSQWRRFVVHFDNLPDDLSNLRIGFDLMGEGQISIDQVEIFDRWFDESDAVAMTQLLASAGSQLRNEASIDSGRRVLESYWVQFLDQYAGKEEQVVDQDLETDRPFEIPLPTLPSFDLPTIGSKKSKRVPLFQRLQRRE